MAVVPADKVTCLSVTRQFLARQANLPTERRACRKDNGMIGTPQSRDANIRSHIDTADEAKAGHGSDPVENGCDLLELRMIGGAPKRTRP